ncbi:ABC-type branched-subunit amino acid transport system substrate-binding protein [Pontibacter aydingkolensis]|uniref:ABC transporter substrate-binding protein n=1 Tax=Pontibacter aydingkolensis TaxID=1911536 RepID=A0ABS7CYY8_9BACT|nr:ABC transporter substrate-binding protein [Pontibacter aydingkolensis]MBW7469068.1 ABC transporter substrate-binding protein [Pontibacter aydingkolensis]
MPRINLRLKQVAIIIAGVILIGFILYNHYYSRPSLKGHYTIGVILNNIELTPNDMEVVRYVVKRKTDLINQQGGVNGRELRVKYLDDKGNPEVAKQVVQETISDKNMIGYVGCWSSTRSKAISEIVGPARMPFIGGYALTTLFVDFPTMFTAEQSIKDVSARFDLLLKSKYKRPAFIGKTNDLYSIVLLEQLRELQKSDPTVKVVLEKWYPAEYNFTQANYDSISDMLAKEADFLLLSFESGITSAIVKEIRKAGITVPVFTALGDLGFVVSQTDGKYAGELFDLNVVGIPGTFNLRLQEQIPTFMNEISASETLELQLSFSARLADSIGIIAEAAKTGDVEIENIRERINNGMQKYIGGGRIYRGWFDDWYFTPDRAIAGDVLLAWKPPLLPRPILAPDQYMRVNDTLVKIPVFYTHMNMVQINRVSDTEGSFYATFYLEITSPSKVSVQQIDFTNAARSETSHEYLLDIKPIRTQELPGAPPLYNYMYKISGKFLFEPDLKNYPFDKQKFSIHFQPASAVQPFLVQPSTTALNDSVFDVKGWHYRNQYVGYDHDIISFVNTFTDKQQTLPFYKFSYTYVLARARVDFFLKVLTPLLVILIVTYFSIFIPLHRFETMEAMQVTSLLASIALYFSAYKPEMEYATISDKIFIFTYIMITSLIGTSILQFVKRKKYNTESRIAKIYQHYIFPIIILLITLVIVS